MTKRILIVTGPFLLFLLFISASKGYSQKSIIPIPQESTYFDGQIGFASLRISGDYSDIELNELEKLGLNLSESGKVEIHFVDKEVKNPYEIEGAYELIINSTISIASSSTRGFFYGLQSLKQLLQKNPNGSFLLPKAHIKDWPAFEIRGFMHDVGRNFQSLDLLKEQIDIMAFYKFSVFHFHLTDNPGWRLESKLYPQLQDSTATSRKPGQFYSQEDFVELFEYCEDRHITLIPELDIPGHTEAFRKALNLKTMNQPEVQQIICDLIDELCSLVPAERMPYIHLGTDEARRVSEKVDKEYLIPIIKTVTNNGRKYISWWHGIQTPGDSTSIKQLWAQSETLEGHPMIDSRSNYVNHLDPLAGMYRLFFQQPCRVLHGDDMHLGGILCCWPDNRVEEERNILRQNPVYPAMVFYGNSIWRGRKQSGYDYWAKLPGDSSDSSAVGFSEFEEMVIEHRDLYFEGKEFPYVRHSYIPWRIIGPFNHGGDVQKHFPVEDEFLDTYTVDNKEYRWWDEIVHGGTVHIKHFFGFPSYVQEPAGTVYTTTKIWSPKDQEVGFWIGFHNWSRSGGRRGGPSPEQGEWHHTQPRIWIGDNEIEPPLWINPGLPVKTPEIPWANEDYYYREPTMVSLKKGWNKVLLKVPFTKQSFKWMYTCVPVKWDGVNVSEMSGLRFSISE